MLTRWADGNISAEATTQSGNIFPEATRTPQRVHFLPFATYGADSRSCGAVDVGHSTRCTEGPKTGDTTIGR